MRSLIPRPPPGPIGWPRALTMACASLALLLAGCLKPDERHVGVDDFPNTIQARVKGFLGESRKSGEIGPVPALTDSLLALQGFSVGSAKIAAAKLSAAPKISAAMMPAVGNAADTCSSTFKFDTTVTTPLKTTVNSVTLCVDAKFWDDVKGNETILRGSSVSDFRSGRVESVDFTDADGDGMLNPVPGGKSKARMIITAADGGIVERTVLVVGPGPDGDFDTEADNQIYEAGWAKTGDSGKDTLGTAAYTDADDDGIVVDNAKPSVVDLELYERGPTQEHPDAAWSRVNMRLVIRYGVESKEVRRVRFQMESSDGRLQTAELLNAFGGRDLDFLAAVKARFLTVDTAQADTLDTLETFLTMKLGAGLDDKGDDSVKAMEVRAVKKSGEEKTSHFTFASDSPIPSGGDAKSGRISMQIGYADSSKVEVDGDLTDEGLDVTIKDREGKSRHVVWDRLGRGVLIEDIH